MQTGHLTLRALLTFFILKNDTIFGGLCNEKVEDYCTRMSKEAIYGTQAELHAAASYFQVPIFVLDKPNETRGWGWIKYTPVNSARLNFTGTPSISLPLDWKSSGSSL